MEILGENNMNIEEWRKNNPMDYYKALRILAEADDGRVATTSNRFTMYGTKPYARKIECASVDLGEFNG